MGALDVRPVPVRDAAVPGAGPAPRLPAARHRGPRLRRRRDGARGRARRRAPDGLPRAAQARPVPQGTLRPGPPRRPLPLPHAPARGGRRPAGRVRPAPRHRRPGARLQGLGAGAACQGLLARVVTRPPSGATNLCDGPPGRGGRRHDGGSDGTGPAHPHPAARLRRPARGRDDAVRQGGHPRAGDRGAPRRPSLGGRGDGRADGRDRARGRVHHLGGALRLRRLDGGAGRRRASSPPPHAACSAPWSSRWAAPARAASSASTRSRA